MSRQVLTDEIWMQLEKTMRFPGCHKWSNDRSVMEAKNRNAMARYSQRKS